MGLASRYPGCKSFLAPLVWRVCGAAQVDLWLGVGWPFPGSQALGTMYYIYENTAKLHVFIVWCRDMAGRNPNPNHTSPDHFSTSTQPHCVDIADLLSLLSLHSSTSLCFIRTLLVHLAGFGYPSWGYPVFPHSVSEIAAVLVSLALGFCSLPPLHPLATTELCLTLMAVSGACNQKYT